MVCSKNTQTLQVRGYSRSTIEGLLDIFASPSSKNIIFWDNAYAVHDLSNQSPLIDIFSLAKEKKMRIL